MNLIFFGPPGAGKGTYASRVALATGLQHIATGDIFRGEIKKKTSLGKKAASYINKGKYVPDNLTIEMVKKVLKKEKNGFILDGFPRTIKQAKALEKEDIMINMVINFVVSSATIIDRLSGRLICPKCKRIYHIRNLPPKKAGICDKCRSKLIRREDEKPAVVKKRLEVYKKQTQPLLEFYRKKNLLINIDGDRKVGIVIRELLKIIKNLK